MYCEHNVHLIPDASEITEPREGICAVAWARDVILTARAENCGMSVMCRDGMAQLAAIINDLVSGKGQGDDIALIRDLCEVISNSKGCDLAQKAAAGVLFSLDKYAEDWDAHCRRKRCAQLVCPSYFGVYIDPAVCNGCGDCLKNSPTGAIVGGDGMIHVVKDDAGLKGADFIACCAPGAIKKYGAVKPRIPEDPTPVGSAGADGGAEGGRRSRRRNLS